MPPYLECIQQLPEWILPTALWLLGGSLAGLVALWGSLLAFPPEIVIESVVDVSKTFNSTSALRMKNSGRLPALYVIPDATDINAVIMTNTFTNCGAYDGPKLISKLTHGETSDIPITVGFSIPTSTVIEKFEYILKLKYKANLIVFHKSFSKRWKIKLVQRPDGYSWVTQIIDKD